MKHEKLIYSIEPTGKVTGLYDDEFDLSSLGKQQIIRATSIDHNPDTQLFDVVLLPNGECYTPCRGFDKYSHGNAFEVEWLHLCMEALVEPNSAEGKSLAYTARNIIDKDLEDGVGTKKLYRPNNKHNPKGELQDSLLSV